MNDLRGRATTYALQASLNTPAGGVISNQMLMPKNTLRVVSTGWEFEEIPMRGSLYDPGTSGEAGCRGRWFHRSRNDLVSSSTSRFVGTTFEVDGVAGYRTGGVPERSNGTLLAMIRKRGPSRRDEV